MKRMILYVFLIVFLITGIATAGGMGHHPTRSRYGYVGMPLSGFTTDGIGLQASALTKNRKWNVTDNEGSISSAELLFRKRSGTPAIIMGRTESPVEYTFDIPLDYWRDGVIEAKVENLAALGQSFEWGVRVHTSTAQDTTYSVETDVATQSPASGTVERISFEPASDFEGTAGLDAGGSATFYMNKKYRLLQGTTNDNTIRHPNFGPAIFYHFTFKYEKKSDT